MTSIRIGTFNLESLDDRPGQDPPIEARIAVLRPQLERLRADVLCLQEVNSQDAPDGGPRTLSALERLIEGTPYAGFQSVVSMRPSGKGPADLHNLVILSRFPIQRSAQYRHDLVPALSYQHMSADPPAEASPLEWDRPLLYAALDLGDRLLHVFDLHLRAPLAAFIPGQKADPHTWKTVEGWAEGFFVASVKRVGQALETRLVVDRIFDAEPDALIAVCGDFNADLPDVPVRTILASVDDTGNPALESRSLHPLELKLPEEQRFSVLHAGRAQLLDHVLASPSLRTALRGVEIHNEALEDEAPDNEPTPLRPAGSFHAAMVVELEIPRR